MTNKEIKQAEKELCSAEKMEKGPKRRDELKRWAKNYCMHLVEIREKGSAYWQDDMFEAAHRLLQTATMVKTCKIAMWSCFWAAMAATVAALGAIAAWITVAVTL